MPANFFNEEEIKLFAFDDIKEEELDDLLKEIPVDVKEKILRVRENKSFHLFELFKVIKYLYIGINIRNEYGLVDKDIVYSVKNGDKYIEFLKDIDLFQKVKMPSSFRKLEILNLTEDGKKIGKLLVNMYLGRLDYEELINHFNNFLLFYVYEKKIDRIPEHFRHSKTPRVRFHNVIAYFEQEVNDITTWSNVFYEKCFELFIYLEEKGLCVKASHYVSSNGGETREKYYLIPTDFYIDLKQYQNKFNFIENRKRFKSFEKEVSKNMSVFRWFKLYNNDGYSYRGFPEEVNISIHKTIKDLAKKELICLNDTYTDKKDLKEPPFIIIEQGKYIRDVTAIEYDSLKEALDDLNTLLESSEGSGKELSAVKTKQKENVNVQHPFNVDQIAILRGGDWKLEAGQSTFIYKVKIKNTSSFVITNIQIILGKIPPGLSLGNDKLIEFSNLAPQSEVSPTFKLVATDNCVGNVLNALVNFNDYMNNTHSIKVEPFEIKYVCNLITPKQIKREDYDERTEFMEENKIELESSLNIAELEKTITEKVMECNFALLEQLQESQKDSFRKLEGFGQGLYDKQDVALKVLLQKQDDTTKVVVKALSKDTNKLMDILKDFNSKLDDIKSDTELLNEYGPQLEAILEKSEDIEQYLVDHLASDWEKIRIAWIAYRAGEMTKKKFIALGLKSLGKNFVKALLHLNLEA